MISHLKNYTILEAKGKDAQTFLQGQVSQDLLALEIGQARWFGISNAKGRLLAVGQVYSVSEDTYWLVFPNAVAEMIATHLVKFKFRSKVELSVRNDLYLYGIWDEASLGFEDFFPLGNLFIGISEHEITDRQLVNNELWTLQKILNGLPDVFTETQETFVAQMLNLDLLNGVSFSKGCYTGQEIIARMQHLGRIKRRTLLLELNGSIAIGEKFEFEGHNLGQAVSAIETDDKTLALVCIQLDKLKKLNDKNLPFKVLNLPYDIPELED